MKREKAYEKALRMEAKKRGGVALKFVSPGHRGATDRLVLLPGAWIAFAEAKQTGKNLTPLQELFKRMVLNLGFRHYKVDSVECVDKLFTDYDFDNAV